MTFRLRYFAVFVVLFAIEAAIAIYIHDDFVRPYLGDLLVVILIYAFARAFAKISVRAAVGLTLAFAFLVEFLQLVNIVETLGLSGNTIARVVIGTSFAWEDLAMYIIGAAAVLLCEKSFKKD